MSLPSFDFRFRHILLNLIWNSRLPGKGTLSRLLSRLLIRKAPGECVVRTSTGLKMIVDPVLDKGVEDKLYYFGTYEAGTLQFITEHLRKGDVFIDVGANIGLMSLFASSIVGDSGSVHAFEPNPVTVSILERNIQLNRRNNIKIWQKALGSASGTLPIYDNWQVNRGGATLVRPDKPTGHSEVEVQTWDGIDELRNVVPRMIKIDVEGFELDVLLGMKDLLKRTVPLLIVEWSPERRINHASVNDIYEFILSLGIYRVCKMSRTKERTGRLLTINSRAELPPHDNIFCLPLTR